MNKLFCVLFLLIFATACSSSQASRSSPTIEAVEITSTYPVTATLPIGIPTMTPVNSPYSNPSETVTFTTSDGINLAGTLFGDGDIAVILAHQGTPGADQRSWQSFASLLSEHGYTTLTFDFRGVGRSEGRLQYSHLAMDVSAAAQFLEERGYQKILCVGASMGGTACIRAAQEHTFGGLVILASTMTAGSGANSLRLTPEDLEGLTQPRLFISAEKDFSLVVNDTKRMYELSPNPKILLFLPGMQHGTKLFDTDSGEALSAAMLRFIENIDVMVSGSLPELQPITPENAGEVQLLRTMEIPGYQKGRLSQCSLAFSPDGRLLVGVCGKNQVPLWDVQSGYLLRALYDAREQIVTCDFSSDGNIIACGGFDKTVTLWDANTGEAIGSFEGHTAPIWEIAFDPFGKSLASCSLGLLEGGNGPGEVRLWNIPHGEPTWSFAGTRDYLSVSFDPSGAAIAYGSIGGSVGILDAESGELIRELTDSSHNIGDVAFSPSGPWLAAGSDDNYVYLWNTSNFEFDKFPDHKGYVNGVAFNPDETLLASGSHDKTVGIWSVPDQKLIRQLSGHEREVLRVAFSPNGTLIASISWDGTVRLWGIVQ